MPKHKKSIIEAALFNEAGDVISKSHLSGLPRKECGGAYLRLEDETLWYNPKSPEMDNTLWKCFHKPGDLTVEEIGRLGHIVQNYIRLIEFDLRTGKKKLRMLNQALEVQ
jgi:hypothetical protein